MSDEKRVDREELRRALEREYALPCDGRLFRRAAHELLAQQPASDEEIERIAITLNDEPWSGKSEPVQKAYKQGVADGIRYEQRRLGIAPAKGEGE